jgi:hypothetical protein
MDARIVVDELPDRLYDMIIGDAFTDPLSFDYC